VGQDVDPLAARAPGGQHDRAADPRGEFPDRAQLVGVGAGEQAGLGRRLERLDRAGGPQRRDPAGVLQLQELRRPFDVGQPTTAQFEVSVRRHAAWEALRFHPGLDPAQLARLRVREPVRGVAQRFDEGQEPLRQILVPGHRPGPKQRLPLPRLRPPLVVLGVGAERPRQGAVAPLGAEGGIHLERGLGAEVAQQRAQVAERPDGELLRLDRVSTGQRVVDEEHVGVARVAHLLAPEASHRHHEEARGGLVEPGPTDRLDLCDPQRAAQHHIRGGGNHVRVAVAGTPVEHVSDRGTVQLASPQPA